MRQKIFNQIFNILLLTCVCIFVGGASRYEPFAGANSCELYSFGSFANPKNEAELVSSFGDLRELFVGPFAKGQGDAELVCGERTFNARLSYQDSSVLGYGRSQTFINVAPNAFERGLVGDHYVIEFANENSKEKRFVAILCPSPMDVSPNSEINFLVTQVYCGEDEIISVRHAVSSISRNAVFVITIVCKEEQATIMIIEPEKNLGNRALFRELARISTEIL